MVLPTWTADQWISLAACTGEFLAAAVAHTRRPRDPLTSLVGFLSLDIGTWTFAGFAYSISGQLTWQWLNASASPWTPQLALAFAVTFVGQRRRLRRVLRFSGLAFGTLSAIGVLAFFLQPVRILVLGPWWSICFLVLLIPGTAGMLGLVLSHLRSLPRGLERERTLMLGFGLGLTCTGLATDLLAGAGAPVPRLATLVVLGGNLLLLVVALRRPLFDEKPPPQPTVAAGLVALVATALLVSGVRSLTPRLAVQLFACAALVAVLLAIGIPLWRRVQVGAQQLVPLATLGRMSDQLAHDLLNPLAALDGTVDVLRKDLRAGTVVLERHERALQRMNEQVERMKGVIARYRRLGAMKLEPRLLDTTSLLLTTLSIDHLRRQNIEVRALLAQGPASAMVDEEVFSVIVDNLIRNAVEAMPGGGTLTIRNESVEVPERGVKIRIEDTGCGMNPRVLDRAFDAHFTTKPKGTGLGLPFVRQAVEAHQGSISLHSREGEGTEIELFFPMTLAEVERREG